MHPWRPQYRSPSIASAMRARGVARALGQLPYGFDMHATVLTPSTRRLGGLGGLGAGELRPADPRVPGPYTAPDPAVTIATEMAYAAPSLMQSRLQTAAAMSTTIPQQVQSVSQPSPYVSMSFQPSGSTPVSTLRTRADYAIPTGLPQASNQVIDAHLAHQMIPVLPGDPRLPAPDVHVPSIMEIPYGDDTRTAGPIVTPNGGHAYRLPFGWPWWVWALVAAGAGTGVYALTRR